jgi:hypothetical protein
MWAVRVFWRRQSLLKFGTGQSSPARSSRLATILVACRSGNPNSALSVRQAWIAESVKTG